MSSKEEIDHVVLLYKFSKDDYLFEQIVGFVEKKIDYMCKRYSRVFSGFSWDEVRQLCLISLIKIINDYDPKKGRFETFASYCMDLYIKNKIRKEYYRKQKEFENNPYHYYDLNAEVIDERAKNAYEIAYSNERRRRVKEVVGSRLDGIKRDAFLLWLDGYNYEEIAAKLNVSKKSVDNAIYRATLLLREKKDFIKERLKVK